MFLDFDVQSVDIANPNLKTLILTNRAAEKELQNKNKIEFKNEHFRTLLSSSDLLKTVFTMHKIILKYIICH